MPLPQVLIVAFIGYNVPDTALGVFTIALSSWNEVYVGVPYGLACHAPTIHTNIETFYFLIGLQ
jgi:hypothetical protein